jgi:hypothetical protein
MQCRSPSGLVVVHIRGNFVEYAVDFEIVHCQYTRGRAADVGQLRTSHCLLLV